MVLIIPSGDHPGAKSMVCFPSPVWSAIQGATQCIKSKTKHENVTKETILCYQQPQTLRLEQVTHWQELGAPARRKSKADPSHFQSDNMA